MAGARKEKGSVGNEGCPPARRHAGGCHREESGLGGVGSAAAYPVRRVSRRPPKELSPARGAAVSVEQAYQVHVTRRRKQGSV